MRSRLARQFLGTALLLAAFSSAYAAESGIYLGAGIGLSKLSHGSTSNPGLKYFWGFHVHDFPVQKLAGDIQFSVQAEYVNFGKSDWAGTTWNNSGVALAGMGKWVLPRKWGEWGDERFAVVAKLGLARIAPKSSNGTTITYTGITQGTGAEYRFAPAASVRGMIEFYPNGYRLNSLAVMISF